MNRARVSGPVYDTTDAPALARFYAELLGWQVVESFEAADGGWAKIMSPTAHMKIEFQGSPSYRRPVWPSAEGEQQMMVHLDIAVPDVEAAVASAVSSGATVAEHQPQPHVRVLLDPDGHPFCLFAGSVD